MSMGFVVHRLTHPQVTTTQQFLGVVRHYPFTGGGTNDSFRQFVDIAISVCDGSQAGAKRDALGLVYGLVRFRGTLLNGFPFLDLDDVIYQLVLRVLEPRLVDQGSFGLCGPAAFAVVLAKTDPVRYVQVASELLTTGRSRIRGLDIKPNDQIRQFRPGTTPDADWLVLASLRNSDQALDQSMKNTGEYGGTNYPRMVDWLKRAGYGAVVGAFAPHLTGVLETFSHLPLIHQIDSWSTCEFHPTCPSFLNGISYTQFTNQSVNLFLADRFCRNKWKVFLLVSEKYSQTSGNDDPIESKIEPLRQLGAPNLDKLEQSAIAQLVGTGCNHWVVAKEIHFEPNGKVRITRYSWGGKSTTAPVSRDLFYRIYSGFIAVTPLDVRTAVANWHW